MASASRCSSSSFQHSSRYSTSTVSSDHLHPRLHSQFEEETSIHPFTDGPEPEQQSFTCYHGNALDGSSCGYQGDQESFGCYSKDQTYTQGGYPGNWSLGDTVKQVPGSSMGVVRAMGDGYFLSTDVSEFEPQEVVVLAYNQCVVIHAEKTGAEGNVSSRFTQKSLLPEDMDPLSVSSTLTAERMLVIRVGRKPTHPPL